MITNVEILFTLTKFDQFKMDEEAPLQLLKRLVLIHLVFGSVATQSSADLMEFNGFSTLRTWLLSNGMDWDGD